MENEIELSVAEKKKKKRSGYLFIAGACMFFLAAVLSGQAMMAASGVIFIAVGATYLSKAK